MDNSLSLKDILFKSHFLTKMMRMKLKKRSSSKVSHGVEEWCKCGKYEPILTEKVCKYCHGAASYYLNGNIRGRSRNLAPSKLEIFATNDSQIPDASNVTKGSMLEFLSFKLRKYLFRGLI